MNRFLFSVLFFFASLSFKTVAEWNFDFSRRGSLQPKKNEPLRQPSSESLPQVEPLDLWSGLQTSEEPTQEMVILSTKTGFVPDRVRMRAGQRYKVTVVNVNEEHKNISFVLEAFSEFHGTYYGQLKSFFVKPAKEGQVSFTTPELGHKGQLIVMPAPEGIEIRKPAGE